MALLTLDTMPAALARLARDAARFAGAPESELVLADAAHEELSEGAYSIALEGGLYDWPFLLSEEIYAGRIARPAGWHLEALNNCTLACYPDE